MLLRLKTDNHGAMASPWRRRRPCTIRAVDDHQAALIEISGRGALVETGANLALGAEVVLAHPEAGPIAGVVEALTPRGIRIAFPPSEPSVAFALAAITADMSDPVY